MDLFIKVSSKHISRSKVIFMKFRYIYKIFKNCLDFFQEIILVFLGIF